MTLAEIMQKITELTSEDRAILHRELEETLHKQDVEKASPEMREAIEKECASAGEERGLPIEDLIRDPKPDA